MAAAPGKSPRVPRRVGASAGLLAIALLVFSAVGALWGVLRPVATARPAPGSGGFLIDAADSAQFTGFITFAACIGLLSAIVAITVYLLAPAQPRGGTYLWLIFVVIAASAAFYLVGDVTSPHLSQQAASENAELRFAPPFEPWLGFIAGPFMAAATYWLAAVSDFLAEPAAWRDAGDY